VPQPTASPVSIPEARASIAALPVSILDSAELFGQGASEVRIVHRGQEYRLRITRQGKLILTK
jgi:hemin uptake protein HemP